MTNSRMITLLLLLTAPPVVCGQEVQWHLDLNTAQKAAKDKNRPLLLDFGTVSVVLSAGSAGLSDNLCIPNRDKTALKNPLN